MNTHPRRAALAGVALLTLAACGGGQKSTRTAAKQTVHDTTPPPARYQPLPDSDLEGLARADVSLNLPWTGNSVLRAPTPAAASAMLEAVEVSSHPSFDRVMFTFGSGTPFPGYDVRLVKPGSSLSCDGKERAPKLKGAAILAVTLTPARSGRGRRHTVPVRISRVRHAQRILEQGLTCDAADSVTWVGALAKGSEVRILELMKPDRLVVDVR